MKTQLFYLLLAIGVVFTQSCDEIDNLSGGASAPEVTYSATTYEAEFYKAGNSATPSIDWNGSQGSASLGTMIDGLSVNSTTGQLQWTKLLPPGTHDVEVVVTNSEGQVVIPMTISNPLRGKFAGTMTESGRPLEGDIEFASDGSASLYVRDSDRTFTTDDYTIQSDGSVLVQLTRTSSETKVTFIGDLNQTKDPAEYSGFWYNGHVTGPEAGSEAGEFTLHLE
ncbi:hypothetical protein [Lewinella sp. IMCC34191]|uniref:hypothetical protein n=1 Tax=Lewinella sp. IMCC34191 TaxID=2259172 RepID=UPI000E270656|nr:hypothetical protein [Lewinella sp. IMCC34191]